MPYAFVAQPIGSPALRAVRDDPATVVERIGPDSPLAGTLPRPPGIIQARFAGGADCWAVTVKGRFAGTIWIARSGYLEDEVRCRYVLAQPEISAWDFDVYVSPEFRLGRTMARLWKAVDVALAVEGVQWSFSRISMFNVSSMSSHARLGAVRVGWAVFLVVGNLQLAVFRHFPFINLSAANVGIPAVRFHVPGKRSPRFNSRT